MNIDDTSDVSTLTSAPASPSSPCPSSSELSSVQSRTPSPPPYIRSFTPPPSQDAGEDMPRPRKRRKIEPKIRTTQHLDLTSVTAQSEYDRQQAEETLIRALRNRRKIVVVAGAGISVSAGIPDFRSSHGLFRTMKGAHKLKGSGKQLFDASVYKDDSSTSHFHDMVRQLAKMSETAQPTPFHRFIARLSTEGRLLRLYTQNVDGLENELEPLKTTVPLPHKAPWPQTVQLHGGLEKMTCQKCRQISDFDPKLFEGPTPPPCPQCVETDNTRTNVAGKRSHGIGRLRPRIVLYNEHNPDDEAIGAVTTADMRTRPDAVVVVGTSMKIPGVRRIVSQMCRIVRDRREGTTIWINREGVPAGKDLEDCWDLIVKGDSDEVAQMADLKQWDDPTPAEEYTDSDVDRVKNAQREIKIILPPSPDKKSVATLAIGNTMTSALTPPRSHGSDSEAVFDVKPKSPIKLKFSMLKSSGNGGRTLANGSTGKVLDGKPKKQLGRPPKNSVIKKPSATKAPHPLSGGQSRIVAKVSKANSKSTAMANLAKKQPLSPRKGSDLNTIKSIVSEIQSFPSIVSSPLTAHSSVFGSPSWSGEDTINPSGKVPKDMLKLLN